MILDVKTNSHHRCKQCSDKDVKKKRENCNFIAKYFNVRGLILYRIPTHVLYKTF